MKKNLFKQLLILSFILLFSFQIFAEDVDYKKEYLKMRSHFIKLYKAGKYQQGIKYLNNQVDKFPEKESVICWNIAVSYLKLNKPKRAFKELRKAQKRGTWFNIYGFESKFWSKYKNMKAFKRVIKENNKLREMAELKAKPVMKIVLPEKFDSEKKYPLFIALHGGGENKEVFAERFKSEILNREFITAYFQSTQMVSAQGYHWQDLKKSEKDIKLLYSRVMEKYKIDKTSVYAGGFSSGGYAALHTVFAGIIPVKGFIVLCPVIPESLNQKSVETAVSKGIRGTVITSRIDPRKDSQRNAVEIFKKSGLQYQFVSDLNSGHWYPANLSKLIESAVNHIRYR